MSLIHPINLLDSYDQIEGKVSWQSPSNIALIKYWGKRPVQLPANASISFTLSEAHTITSVAYQPRKSEWVHFSFEGSTEESFADRIVKYLTSLSEIMPWLQLLSFKIESSNSFPHSSGIASSASSMSALSLCLCDIEKMIHKVPHDNENFLKKASYIARLGSGSAARSIYPRLASWGVSSFLTNGADEFATEVKGVKDVFDTFHDDIIIVSDAKKSVSSSAGHALMDNNIFSKSRYQQANLHMSILLKAMAEGDLMTFGKVVEDEALSLHALMMCSDPSYILMKPGTLEVIENIRAFRKETNLPLFFTLDAGPNVHMIYPDSIKRQVNDFTNSRLVSIAHDGRIIKDHVGLGPVKIL